MEMDAILMTSECLRGTLLPNKNNIQFTFKIETDLWTLFYPKLHNK